MDGAVEGIKGQFSIGRQPCYHLRRISAIEGHHIPRKDEPPTPGSLPYVASPPSPLQLYPLLTPAVLGALSKSIATIVTQPLIVAKVGLQSRPPPARQGKPFKSFIEVMSFIIEHEGLLALFKGIGPQITKGLLVQGLLMMTKERYVLALLLRWDLVWLILVQDGNPLHRPLRLPPQAPVRQTAKTCGYRGGEGKACFTGYCEVRFYVVAHITLYINAIMPRRSSGPFLNYMRSSVQRLMLSNPHAKHCSSREVQKVFKSLVTRHS